MRKSTKSIIAVIVLGVVLIGALYGSGVFALLASFGKVVAPSGAVWRVTITAGAVAVAAESAVISADGHTVDLYDGLADWQLVADNGNIDLTFDLVNRNTGSNTQTYTADGRITSVSSPEGGTGTAFLVLKDGNGNWDVAYTGYASGSELNDLLSVTVVTAASDAGIVATMEARAAGFDDFQASGNYAITFVMADITLTMAFHVTGA
jgi:hypothetical protein